MEKYIKKALELAKKSYDLNEVPVGALIVLDDKIIGKGYNTKEKTNNILNHAEIIAINKAAKKINSWKLNNCTLISTLEPCDLCKRAIEHSRIKNVIYLSKQDKRVNYKTTYKFVKKAESEKLVKDFFKKHRK